MKQNQKSKSARAVAYEALFKFEKTLGRLDDISERALQANPMSARERRLFKNLVSGVVRHRLYLNWIGQQLYKGRYKKLLFKFRVLLRLGLYELIFLSAIPAHATLNEYVNLAKKKLNPTQAKILNALLRSYLRRKEELDPAVQIKDTVQRLSVQYSFPEWMVKRWIGFWGARETEALCASLNEPPDFDIRINTNKISVKKFKRLLLSEKVPFAETEWDDEVIRVKDIQPFLRQRWFEKGYCLVQDESAALVIRQLDLKAGIDYLDMCAAPGGKYIQALKAAGEQARLIAADADAARLKKVKQNVQNLMLDGGHYVAADGRKLPFKNRFDQILIDAPCSGLGVIRKHPDIKWRRSFREIVEFSKIQLDLLRAAHKQLKSGGLIVYSTCTIDYFENENVIESFLQEFGNEYELLPPIVPEESMKQGNFLRIFPHKHGMDGSFCARLLKK